MVDWNIILIFVMSYFLGSIPFGYLVGKYIKKIDITKHGSGNIGTTNAFRILGPGPASFVLAGDVLKGFIATFIAMQYSITIGLIAGLIVMAGHNWPIFLKFKGGRGVATGAGVVLALVPKVLLISLVIWIAIIFLTRYVSLGSIIGAITVPILMIIFKEPPIIILFGTIAALFVIIRHIPNIKRLLAGNELKIGKKA